MKRFSLFWRVLPVHILIVLLLLTPLGQKHFAKAKAVQTANQAQARLTTGPKPETKLVELMGNPMRIVIPRLAIDVDVVVGTYDKKLKTWSVAGNAANYAPNTAPINNAHDTSLIYGHWNAHVFGPTKNIAFKDVVYVYTDNGHVFKYEYTGESLVKPTDIQIFDNLKGKPSLLLMTCDGRWAQNRRLMHFELVDAI